MKRITIEIGPELFKRLCDGNCIIVTAGEDEEIEIKLMELSKNEWQGIKDEYPDLPLVTGKMKKANNEM